MTPDEIIEIIADELHKYAIGIHPMEDDEDFDENVVYDARYLYNKIAGQIQAAAYDISAARMQQLKELNPDGDISLDQAVEYLQDAAARARNK